MNLCMFFEGTGHGVAGKITNVTRPGDFSIDDAWQKPWLTALQNLWYNFRQTRKEWQIVSVVGGIFMTKEEVQEVIELK